MCNWSLASQYISLSFFFVILTKQTFVADLVLHLQCINIQKSNTEPQQRSHTYVQHYQRGARQKIPTRGEQCQKNKKKTNYKYLPCWYLNKWKGDQHSIQKYHNFIYQMASVGSCSGLHSYKEILIDRISIFFFLPFILDYHLQSQLSNAQCTAAYDLILVVQALWTIFFFFFTLQNYNSIHIFSSLMLFF